MSSKHALGPIKRTNLEVVGQPDGDEKVAPIGTNLEVVGHPDGDEEVGLELLPLLGVGHPARLLVAQHRLHLTNS